MSNKLFDIDEIALSSKKNNEWYTSHIYIEAARSVMNGIDLDPASCELANKTVKATKYYDKAINGLIQPWYGKIWLNPPFGRMNAQKNSALGSAGGKSIMALFVARLIHEYQSGNIKQAILLATSKTDTAWFQALWEYPICFASHRVLFNRPATKDREGHFFGTCFVYLGPNIASFVKHFVQFGPVITPDGVHRRQPAIQQRSLWDINEEAS